MSTETIEVEVLDPEKPIAAYNPIRAGIQAMRDKYGKTVFSVATADDMKATKDARAEVREVRYNIEKARKALKSPALAYSKRIDDEAKEYTEAIMAIEAPIDELIKAEEKRKAEEKAKREAEEATKRQNIQVAIDEIKSTVMIAVGRSSEHIAILIEVADTRPITLDEFDDRAGEAEVAKQQVLSKLREMYAAALAQEIETKRLADERKALADAKAKADAEDAQRKADLKAQQDEIDRQKKELADAQAAADRKEQERLDAIEAEKQAKIDAEAKAEQEKAVAAAVAAKKKADEEVAEAARRERVQFEQNGPGQDEITAVLAAHYQVSETVVSGWLSALVVAQAA